MVEVVAAGHVCLDVIPRILQPRLPEPGQLHEVGEATIATGGSVSNTGLALHRLGVTTRLVGRIGNDAFGREVRRIYEREGKGLSGDLEVVEGEATSYTVVISPEGGDRRFLHCPGVNSTFDPDCIDDAVVRDSRLLHFGYPPVMQRVCRDGGAALAEMYARARRLGLITSLDMCGVDASGWAGAVDWLGLLGGVLPQVSLFLPSWDEVPAMLGQPDAAPERVDELAAVADRLLGMGCAVAGIKLGADGLYLRSSSDSFRIRAAGLDAAWVGREVLAPTFVVDVRGTTGAGDTTIAGLLSAVVRGGGPEAACDIATATGAFCVGAPDAISGIPRLKRVREFLESRPPRRQPRLRLDEGWSSRDSGLFVRQDNQSSSA